MISLKSKLQKNKKRLSKKQGAITCRQLPRGIRIDLPALGKYLANTGKTYDELSENELQQFVW